jgi:hypothetical protein
VRKNLVIQHLGMNWPIGAIVEADKAFPNGYAGHLALKAVAETDNPATHGIDLPEAPKPGEADAQNHQLRLKVVELEGRVATLLEERTGHLAEIQRLSATNAEQAQLLEQATAASTDAQIEAFNARNSGMTAPEV